MGKDRDPLLTFHQPFSTRYYQTPLPRSPALAVSASDDCTSRLWDTRVRGEVGYLEDDYQLTAVAYANDGNVVYTGGIDNCITAWDLRRMHKSMTMKGHTGKMRVDMSSALFEVLASHYMPFSPPRYHHVSCAKS